MINVLKYNKNYLIVPPLRQSSARGWNLFMHISQCRGINSPTPLPLLSYTNPNTNTIVYSIAYMEITIKSVLVNFAKCT